MSKAPMTRADLYDWIIAHDCEAQPLDEYRAKVLYFVNPSKGGQAWLNLPINESPVKDYTICSICSSLQIPIPTQASYMKEIRAKINSESKRRKKE